MPHYPDMRSTPSVVASSRDTSGEAHPCGMDERGVARPAGRSGMLGSFREEEVQRVGAAEARVGEVRIRIAAKEGNRSGSAPGDTTLAASRILQRP